MTELKKLKEIVEAEMSMYSDQESEIMEAIDADPYNVNGDCHDIDKVEGKIESLCWVLGEIDRLEKGE